MKKVMHDPFEPIPKTEQEEWDKLVKEGKACVSAQDKSTWKLILLAGKVEGKYGEGRVKRFGDEIGLSLQTIHEYRWINRSGVDQQFVTEWGSLPYSLVREVLRHTGKVANPSTEYFLNYARDHKLSVRALKAYMMDTVAPDRMHERASETIKMSLQDKQENEGFSDYIKTQLEKLAEEHPELEDHILKTAIVDVDDFNALKIAAGLATDDEEKMVGQAKYQTDKIKRYHTHLLTVKNELRSHLETGHEKADDLRYQLEKLRNVIDEILSAEFIPLDLPADQVEEVPAGIVKVT